MKIFGLIFLTGTFLLICNTSFAQSVLVIQDGDGDLIGNFEYAPEPAQPRIVVSTIDGVFIEIEPFDGGLFRAYDGLFYTTDDCSGQGYISNPPLPIQERGNVIVQLNSRLTSDSFAKVEWQPGWTNSRARSSKSAPTADCRPRDISPFRGTAAEFVDDPGTYNIKQRDDDSWGFQLPFSSLVVKSGSIFCNGFEGCPIQ